MPVPDERGQGMYSTLVFCTEFAKNWHKVLAGTWCKS